jgi:hypothetical protein
LSELLFHQHNAEAARMVKGTALIFVGHRSESYDPFFMIPHRRQEIDEAG